MDKSGPFQSSGKKNFGLSWQLRFEAALVSTPQEPQKQSLLAGLYARIWLARQARIATRGIAARPLYKEQTMRHIVVTILITLAFATAASNCTPSSSSPAPSQIFDKLNATLKERARKAEERRRAVQEPLDELKEADRKKAIEDAKWRTWTSAGGGFRVEAKFVKFASGTVTLEKKDGLTVAVRMDQLSPDDQDFIKNRKWLQAPP